MRCNLVCLLALLAAPAISPAQVRYQFGDDLRWSDPNFDDSSWPIAKDGRFPIPSGDSTRVTWVRERISVLTADPGPLAIRLPELETTIAIPNELWINGRRVGSMGSFPPHVSIPLRARTAVFEIPPDTLKGGIALIAWRVWSLPFEALTVGSRRMSFEIGPRELLNLREQLAIEKSRIALTFEAAEQIVVFTIGMVLLIVWRKGRGSRAMLWYGLSALSCVSLFGQVIPDVFRPSWPYSVSNVTAPLLVWWALVSLFEFQWAAFALRAVWFLRVLQALVTVSLALNVLGAEPGTSVTLAHDAFWSGSLMLVAAEMARVLISLREIRRWRETRGIALAIILFSVAIALDTTDILPGALKWGPVVVQTEDLSSLIISCAVCYMLLHRFWSTWRERQELETEFEAAREMQTGLVPPATGTPAFSVASAYLPAKHVGGDFFWTVPGIDGSLLLVAGDVSGKGLRAAMTVATLAGALRNESSREPACVLRGLNKVLLNQKTAGFTTCCAALFENDGRLTIANAGHIAPYLNGREMAVEPGLPLGVTADVTYAPHTFSVESADRLTFVSDGVPEARNNTSELYGFDRTRELTERFSAASIAETARAFGQEDDITVITIERMTEAACAA